MAQPWRPFFKLSPQGVWTTRANHLEAELRRLLARKARLSDGHPAAAITLGLTMLVPDIMAEPRTIQTKVA